MHNKQQSFFSRKFILSFSLTAHTVQNAVVAAVAVICIREFVFI